MCVPMLVDDDVSISFGHFSTWIIFNEIHLLVVRNELYDL